MVSFREIDRSQPFLLPPDLQEWVPADDLANFVVEVVEPVENDALKAIGGERASEQIVLSLERIPRRIPEGRRQQHGVARESADLSMVGVPNTCSRPL